MSEQKKNTFTITDKDGNSKTFDVLFTFDSDETGHSYIEYTDNEKDHDGNTQVYASIYYPKDLEKGFEEIKTEKEWKVIETILETIQEEVQKKKGNKE